MSTLPYVTATGNISRAIEAIRRAATPQKVSGDFVKNMLGIKGGAGDQITTYLKKIGLADASGTPTELYNKVRNPTTSAAAISECLKIAYAPLFDRNEYVFSLNDEDLKGLIVEETGNAHDSNPVKMAFACFKALNALADFAAAPSPTITEVSEEPKTSPSPRQQENLNEVAGKSPRLNIGYNIHLNLPATDDIAVFNAIFKSLKENLLVNDE